MTPRSTLSLPPPAIQPGTRKKARFGFGSGSGFRVRWAQITRTLGTSSLDETLDDAADGGSRLVEDSLGEAYKSEPLAWNNVGGSEIEPDEVDVVVVDNVFAGNTTPKSHTNSIHSEKGAQDVVDTHPHTDTLSTTKISVWDRYVTTVRWRIVPFISHFNNQAFLDSVAENRYQRETWISSKTLAIFGSLWLVMNWILMCGLLPRPLVAFDKGLLFGFGPVLSVPIPFFAIFDLPRKKPIFYQCYLVVSVWSWSFAGALSMNLCGFYGSHSYWSCGNKDFVGTIYYSTALPTIALFACGMGRLPALLASLVFVCTVSGIIAPDRKSFVRNIINIFVFNMFILYIHYIREQSERRLFTIRDQVKLQYRATQKAQISERRVADSKRRLTSYIFHEVRVPLNTAMLALQNLEASLPPEDEQVVEFGALSGSLCMMSKDEFGSTYAPLPLLLSDILDFNRMDAGRFESVSKPFSFHRAIRSSMVGLKMAADAKGVKLITEFDREIDLVARAAAYRERGKSEEWIAWQLGCNPDEDAYVLGDEMRLIQVVTNLTSNACKFTPPGPEHSVIVRTKLLYAPPTTTSLSGSTVVPSDSTSIPFTRSEPEGISTTQLSRYNLNQPYSRSPPAQQLVVRIEVQDTGVGIKPRDMIDNRLFSPYVQTEIGRHQGGKGTGLGLALVRHIVKLSGGRLGVKSKRSHGSCFWIEFPLGIAPAPFEPEAVPTLSPLPAARLHQVLTPFDFKTAGEGLDRQALVSYISPGVGFNRMHSTPSTLSHVGSNPQRKSCNGSTTLSATSEVSAAPIHVLVVDDDQLTRRLMQRMLQRIGCTVETAENGQKALELITEERQDSPSVGGKPKIRIIFLDNQMPILSGVELCKELRRRGRKDFVVGITGNALKEDQLEFTQAGADKVLIKPVLERSLREMLNLAPELSES